MELPITVDAIRHIPTVKVTFTFRGMTVNAKALSVIIDDGDRIVRVRTIRGIFDIYREQLINKEQLDNQFELLYREF
jgi:hypothetical protein